MTKEALEAKRKEVAAAKAVLSSNQEEDLKKLEQIEEEKRMFQTELLAVATQLHQAQQVQQEQQNQIAAHVESERALGEKLEETERVLARAVEEKQEAVREVEMLSDKLFLQEQEVASSNSALEGRGKKDEAVLLKELDAVREELLFYKGDIVDKEQAIKALNQKNADLLVAQEGLDQHIAEIIKKVENYEKNLSEKETQIKEASESLRVAQDEGENTDTSLTQFTRTVTHSLLVATLQKQIEEKSKQEAELREAKDLLVARNEEITSLVEQIRRQKEDIERNVQGDKDSAASTIESLKKELESRTEELQRAAEKLEKAHEDARSGAECRELEFSQTHQEQKAVMEAKEKEWEEEKKQLEERRKEWHAEKSNIDEREKEWEEEKRKKAEQEKEWEEERSKREEREKGWDEEKNKMEERRKEWEEEKERLEQQMKEQVQAKEEEMGRMMEDVQESLRLTSEALEHRRDEINRLKVELQHEKDSLSSHQQDHQEIIGTLQHQV